MAPLVLTALAGVADYGHWNSVVAFVVSAAAVCRPRLAGRPVGGAAGRPVRGRRDRRPAVRARQPARAVHLHLRAQGRPGGRRAGGPGRLDPGQPAAGARPGVPGRRAQARGAAARVAAGAHDPRADAAVGVGVGAAVVHPLAAHARRGARGAVLDHRLGAPDRAVPRLAAVLAAPRGRRRERGRRTRRRAGRSRWRSGCSRSPAWPRRSSPTGSSTPCSRRWTRCRSTRPSPDSSWSPSRATRSRTSSASSSRRGTRRRTPSR